MNIVVEKKKSACDKIKTAIAVSLQHTATDCSAATHCNTRFKPMFGVIATHCNTLQHTATHCNTLCDGGGAVIRKPGSAWLKGTPAIHVKYFYVSWCVRVVDTHSMLTC